MEDGTDVEETRAARMREKRRRGSCRSTYLDLSSPPLLLSHTFAKGDPHRKLCALRTIGEEGFLSLSFIVAAVGTTASGKEILLAKSGCASRIRRAQQSLPVLQRSAVRISYSSNTAVLQNSQQSSESGEPGS